MSINWTSHKGEDWSYSDYWCEVYGDCCESPPYSPPAHFVISQIKPKGQLTESRLYEIVLNTQEQFSDLRIDLILTNETEKLLTSLSNKGLLSIEIIKDQYNSKARISNLQPETHAMPAESTKSKKWWQVW